LHLSIKALPKIQVKNSLKNGDDENIKMLLNDSAKGDFILRRNVDNIENNQFRISYFAIR